MMYKREKELDLFRGMSIIWVTIIHCVFWVGLFKQKPDVIIKSYLLIEMPLLFFITGASNYITKKSYRSFVFSRLNRVLTPYYIYSFTCIVFNIIKYKEVSKEILLSWIIPLNSQVSKVPYVTKHLWFITVYVLIIFLIPVLKKIYDSMKKKEIFLVLIFIIVVIMDKKFAYLNKVPNYTFIKHTVFYLFFIYLGFYYWKIKNRTSETIDKVTILIIVNLIILVLSITVGGYSPNMQVNKFPPNLAFMCYSIVSLGFIYLLKDRIVYYVKRACNIKCVNWIMNQYMNKGYTIYLFHPFCFVLIKNVIDIFKLKGLMLEHQIISVLIYIILVIPMAAILGRLLGWIEDVNVKRLFRSNK